MASQGETARPSPSHDSASAATTQSMALASISSRSPAARAVDSKTPSTWPQEGQGWSTDSIGGSDAHEAQTKAIELSTTLFPYLVPPSSWLGTRTFSICYGDGSQRSGCLAQFLADVMPPSYAPMASCFRHSKFLSFAGAGLPAPPACWTALIHGRSVSFRCQESWEAVLLMLETRRVEGCTDGHQLHVDFVPGTTTATVSSDGATQPGNQVGTSSTLPRPSHPETPAEVWVRFMSCLHTDISAPAARLGRLGRGWPSPDEVTEQAQGDSLPFSRDSSTW
ncbi:hypothetical protein GGI35DRAFT_250790 [Trichoderma velutinum]